MMGADTFAMPGPHTLTAVLALLTGLGPLSVDMYLASFPAIGRELAATPAQVQLTISSYLVGFAIAQMFYGPLSDRHGRRPVLLAALAVYLFASLGCALAPTIETLVGARLLQAVGGSGSIVIARAVVRDVYEGPNVGRELARLAAVMALAPIVAPVVGGVLQTAFGWRANFIALLAVGALAAACVWLVLPETVRTRAPEPVSLASMLRSFRSFLGTPSFLAHLGLAACCFAGLFAWISTAAFVLQDQYGLSALGFGLSFMISSAGYLLGTLIAVRFVAHWGIGRTIGVGCAVMAAGGLAMPAALAFSAHSAAVVVGAMALYLIGMGITLPQTQAGALLPFPERAGAASSLLGLAQQTTGAAVGALVGHLLGNSPWPLALTMALAGVLGLLLWAATRALRARAVAD
jgi:DHA1 family bicyclomycin/chloramphenicol resistance-like MFS transporter